VAFGKDSEVSEIYFAPERGAKYCDRLGISVCLFVCLFVCPIAYLENHAAKLHHIFVIHTLPVAHNGDMSCTSGFVDDVILFHSGEYGASCVFASG